MAISFSSMSLKPFPCSLSTLGRARCALIVITFLFPVLVPGLDPDPGPPLCTCGWWVVTYPPPPPPQQLPMVRKHLQRIPSAPSSSSSSSSCPSLSDSEDELKHMSMVPPHLKNKRRLSKQLSMCETRRDLAWEQRRRQMLRRRNGSADTNNLTVGDWNELKACIELGFAFSEEHGHKLCSTFPALDPFFAVNRQLSQSPVSTPHSTASTSSLGERSSSFESTRSDNETWKVCSRGEDPKQVMEKLKHWAQAVACTVLQSRGEQ